MTVILGIDPGTQVTGYGLIVRLLNGQCEAVDFGCIRPPADVAMELKYLALFEGTDDLIVRYNPTVVAVETQFVHKNVQSALKLGMARGAVMIAAAKRGLEVCHFAPRKAKIAVTGQGGASKEQVQRMVQLQLNLPLLPAPDAADALALALCAAYNERRGLRV